MKITKISVYKVDLPMVEGSYSWAGHTFSAFDSTVVQIDTDAGICDLEADNPSIVAVVAIDRDAYLSLLRDLDRVSD